jgi:2-oxoglutarate ferredoxin oxidoreductase subunit alpha
MYWMYNRSLDYTLSWIDSKFGKDPDTVAANAAALRAGYNFGVTTEVFGVSYRVPAATIAPGLYRNITGNQATAIGFTVAAKKANLSLFLGSYPITPASDILHELSRLKNYGVRTFQAEDEIAAVGAAIGAAYSGAIGLTTTSGPGVSLKSEAIGLALMVELPLIICDVQRGGPSTGLPTKTEQADLLQALFGRHAESPVAVVAAATPSDCFDMAFEAVRLATKYMTPVFLLTDGYIANGAEPWRVPNFEELPQIPVEFRTDPEGYLPYARNPETLARSWVRPGTPGLEHRIGGLEKGENTGNVSYDPINHERMVKIRAEKIARIAKDVPPAELFGEPTGDLLLVGWGGTYGSIRAATQQLRQRGIAASHLHIRHMNPLPENVEATLRGFKTVAAAELNLGQLRLVLRAKYLVDVHGINKVQGQPFRVDELVERALALLPKQGGV